MTPPLAGGASGQGDDLRRAYLDAMSRAMATVSVVTTDGPAGRFGLTVSAMTTVSADPPLLLVCLNVASPAAAALLDNGVFAVNVLRADQKRLAQSFAGRLADGSHYDFALASWTTGSSGAPLLAGAAANFDCAIDHTTPAGSHRIVVGRVLEAHTGAGEPLLYGRRDYGRAVPLM